MIRALPHLYQRLRRAMHMHFLRGRRAQLAEGVSTLQRCIDDDKTMLAHMQRELLVVDARLRDAQGHTATAGAR